MKLFLRHAQNDAISRILAKIIDFLKGSQAVRGMFSHYRVPLERIHDVDIRFTELPVSAKTKDEIIYINNKFLEDSDFSEEMHYIVHEMCHWLQQRCDDPYDRFPKEGTDYLDMPSEWEAFMYQAHFMREFYGDGRAEEYVDDLLDFHEIEGEERKKKREALLLDT
jgi:hypothetical protein